MVVNSQVSALKSVFESNNRNSEIATLAVVAGVVIDLIVLLCFSKDISFKEKAFLVVANLLISIGVAGEFVCGHRASVAGTQLQQISDENVAIARKDAANAIFQAAKLGVKENYLDSFVKRKELDADSQIFDLRKYNSIAIRDAELASTETKILVMKENQLTTSVQKKEMDINRQIVRFKDYASNQQKRSEVIISQLASDQERLEQARTEALSSAEESRKSLAEINSLLNSERAVRQQLLQVIEPRNISVDAANSIIQLIKPFKNQSIDVLVYNQGSDDTLPLSIELASVLKAAHWNVRLWTTISPTRWVKGILISTELNSDAKIVSAAHVLLMSLNGANISCAAWNNFSDGSLPDALHGPIWDAKNVAPIRILVGSKP